MTTIPSIFGDVVWDPYGRFPFNAFSSDEQQQQQQHPVIQIDWRETPEMHIFKADLPGLEKEKVKVEVEDGRVLRISGERNADEEDDGMGNVRWHRIERARGKFVRRFWLPENANTERIKAEIRDGVLTIEVSKETIKKPHVKSVEISSGEKMMKKKARKLICCGN